MQFSGLMGGFNKNPVFLRESGFQRRFKTGGSSPSYPYAESGVCLVVGTHPCWADDVQRALALFPDADFCAVNEAVKLVDAKHFATCHPEKLDFFKSLGHFPKRPHVQQQPGAPVPHDVFIWDVSLFSGSASFAAYVMASIGYDKVILCGCPMNGGGGYAFKTDDGAAHCPRIGNIPEGDNMIISWQNAMAEAVAGGLPRVDKIKSMSGKTKEIFGGVE